MRRVFVSTGCSGSEGHTSSTNLASIRISYPLTELFVGLAEVLVPSSQRRMWGMRRVGNGGGAITWYLQINLKDFKHVLKDTDCSFDRTVVKRQENEGNKEREVWVVAREAGKWKQNERYMEINGRWVVRGLRAQARKKNLGNVSATECIAKSYLIQ